MQNFIVLGLIPGTHIQITFQLWLQVIGILATVVIGWELLRHHRSLSVLILSLYVRRVIADQQLTLSA